MRVYDSQLNIFQCGYTLIELMITIGVISILVAIAIPSYQDYIVKSQVSESFNIAYGLKTSIATNLQQGTCFANGAVVASNIDMSTGKYGIAIITSTMAGLPPCGMYSTALVYPPMSRVKPLR